MTINLQPFIKGGVPKYQAIADALKTAISQGELAPGTRLPTHRSLAEQLGVSVQTVSNAYSLATKMGLVDSTVGSGTYVSNGSVDNEFMLIDNSDREGVAIDLSIAHPVCTVQLQQLFSQTLHQIADDDSEALLRAMRPVQGQPQHIEAGIRWLDTQRMPTESDRLILCNGASHALMLALGTAVQAGDTVACEALVDHGLIARGRILNIRLQGLATDEQGILPEALETLCRQQTVKALCCTPSMSNPGSTHMGLQRRREIAAIAERHGVLVIEDDVYGPLEPNRLPPLASLLPEQAFHVTSLTKILAPGIRAGYLVAPRHLLRHTIGRLAPTTWMATPLPFEIVSRWINDGTLDRLLGFEQQEFAARQKLVDRYLADFRYQRHPNGMHVWLHLPGNWNPDELVTTALQANLLVTGDRPFLVQPEQRRNCIRISLGVESSRSRLTQGLKLLADILNSPPPPTHFLL
ncbi:MAG: PLP-dependent aminotransferase family protein [Sedimenticola sp.]|nr:PLP-dependent aminotransferase family protein [Sedimenticola sp.]